LIGAEAALGIAIGVSLAVVLEASAWRRRCWDCRRVAYASTIDPNTEADSGILVILAQLMAGLMFFAPVSIANCCASSRSA
jgi:hypothetical protein